MRKVLLRMNELRKYEVIKELVDHNGNKRNASLKLGLSLRQIDRLIKKYIPPMTHPWKLASFKKHVEKSHIQRIYA